MADCHARDPADRSWTETTFLPFFVPEPGIFGNLCVLARPNLGVALSSVLDHVSVVQGDYRSGNFLFDESTQRITAVLDWGRGYLGDRHRDLAWTAHRAFGCMAEDGRTFLVSSLTEPAAFFERYERLSGLAVDPVRLRWYTVLNSCQLAIAAIATGSQVVRLGKTHQDILLASVEPVGHGALEDLRRTLEELI